MSESTQSIPRRIFRPKAEGQQSFYRSRRAARFMPGQIVVNCHGMNLTVERIMPDLDYKGRFVYDLRSGGSHVLSIEADLRPLNRTEKYGE